MERLAVQGVRVESRSGSDPLEEVSVGVMTTRMYSDPASVAGDAYVVSSGFVVVLSLLVEVRSGSLFAYEAGMAR